jgi:hypothetical protein
VAADGTPIVAVTDVHQLPIGIGERVRSLPSSSPEDSTDGTPSTTSSLTPRSAPTAPLITFVPQCVLLPLQTSLPTMTSMLLLLFGMSPKEASQQRRRPHPAIGVTLTIMQPNAPISTIARLFLMYRRTHPPTYLTPQSWSVGIESS